MTTGEEGVVGLIAGVAADVDMPLVVYFVGGRLLRSWFERS